MGKLAIKYYFDLMLLAVTFLFVILSFWGLFGGGANPITSKASAVLCFLLPLFLIGDAFLVVFWLIRRRYYWTVIALLPLLCSIRYLGTMYQFRSSGMEKEQVRGVKIATYNVAMFGGEASGFIAQDILLSMKEEKVDILCLQEYDDNMSQTTNSVLYSEYFPYKAFGRDDMIIYSRYPIVKQKKIDFEETNNSAQWADVNVNGKVIRVFNVHMETTSVNRTLAKAGEDLTISEEGKLLGKLYDGYTFGLMVRAGQAALVANEERMSELPVVLCGDFNDVPYSYVYNVLKGQLVDGFRECGSGWMYTYRGGMKKFRIDYIFFDPSFKGVNYYKRELTYSDHFPVFCKIAF